MPLKLVVRTSDSSFPEVMGKLRSDSEKQGWKELLRIPPSLRPKRYFAVQVSCSPIAFDTTLETVDESNDENGSGRCGYQQTFHGCCGAEFSRMILLREMNFVACSDLWDLYIMSYQDHKWDTSLSSVYRCLHMALVPLSDAYIIDECRKWNSWTYLSTCRSCVMRMDLESSIRQYLRQHNTTGTGHFSTSATVHWHVDVFMDSIIDESYKCVSASTAVPLIKHHPSSIAEEQQTNVLISHENFVSLKINEGVVSGTIEKSNQTSNDVALEMGPWEEYLPKQGRYKLRKKQRKRLRELKTKSAK